MKQIELLQSITELFRFQTVSDQNGNEYVLLDNRPIELTDEAEDKTAFEAVWNHVHLVDRVKKSEFHPLIAVGAELGRMLAENLKFHYPQKQFIVFVSVTLKDSMIIRFHQKWDGEVPYYNPEDFNSDTEKILMIEI
jgi:hypothetical protein